jgi:DNA-binding NtrC family response regulator
MDSTQTESLVYESPSTDVEHLALTVVHHPDRELVGVRRLLVEGAEALLGRAPRSFFPGGFEMRSISREHAAVTLVGQQLGVRDLGSHNGTTVNAERVARRHLCEGDVIGVGDVLLMITCGPRAFAEPNHAALIGRSWPLRRLLDSIETYATDEQNVLLVGETGSGKELVARAIHESSGRAGTFLAINCGGMAEGVLQSELFGHTKGAFSGAGASRVGLVEAAAGGTLFLDEIAAASEGLQTSLLRLLETGEYRPVGSSRPLQATARFVAAVQPSAEETHGLRPDLWYRLMRRRIDVPALRQRREDIVVLAHHFAQRCLGRPVRFSRRLAWALLQQAWPGNVRELLAVVEQAALGERDAEVLQATSWLGARDEAVQPPVAARKRRPKAKRPSADALREALDRHEGRVTDVAASYAVDRKTIYRWAKALGVDLSRDP